MNQEKKSISVSYGTYVVNDYKIISKLLRKYKPSQNIGYLNENTKFIQNKKAA